MERPRTRAIRRDSNCRGNPLRLAESFVVSEDKSLVLDDGPACRAAELIAPELRQRGVAAPGEVIPRVQRTVPYELVHVAMEGVRARLGDGVHDSSGGLPVFGRKAAGENGELANGVHTEGGPDHVAGPAVGVIVHANTLPTVVVVGGPLAGDGEFRSETTIAARGLSIVHLGFDQVDARVKSSKRSPVAAVQGQLEYRVRFDLSSQRRRGEINLRRSLCHLDDFRCFPDLHREVELLLSPHREGDRRNYRVEALSRDLDLISPRCQVGSRIVAVEIRLKVPTDTRGSIADGDLRSGYYTARWI